MGRLASNGAAFGLLAFLTLPAAARGDRPLEEGSQEEPKPAEDLEGLLRKLREARQAFNTRHRSRLEELENVRGSTRRLEAELSDLRSRESEADRGLTEVRGDLAKLKAEEAADGLRASLGPDVDRFLREGRDSIDRGIPYRVQDRRQRLGASEEGALSDRMSRAWSFLQEEIRIARSGEALSEEIPLGGGRAKPARVFRVGHLVMGYVTEDGLEAGLWNGSQWTPTASPGQERSVREALDILERRRAPELIRLPLLKRRPS